jgi:hypothetical protein
VKIAGNIPVSVPMTIRNVIYVGNIPVNVSTAIRNVKDAGNIPVNVMIPMVSVKIAEGTPVFVMIRPSLHELLVLTSQALLLLREQVMLH